MPTTDPLHRLNDLLGARVVLGDGREAGHVSDVRLAGGDDLGSHVVDGLLVGRPGAASMLGYDRREAKGPWLVRVLVRAANRDAGYVPWWAVRQIDWGAGRVVVDRVDPLTDQHPAG